MDILETINSEKDINKLKNFTTGHINNLFKAIEKEEYRRYVYELILNNMDFNTEFEYFDNPKVSIVIPVKDNFPMTAALLQAIKRETQNIEYEVIIADDNSTDKITQTELIFKNVKRIVNDTGHTGFIYNMNNAISKARGEYIFSMNNDMIPLSDYLKELLTVIENHKEIGIAGAKTLNIDGSIRECGSKIEKDGDACFIGENEQFDYMDDKDYIECDYCSGCSILFRRDIWEKAGKFDINYAPAYYDDSDFAFNLKYNFNLKSVCVPKSKIFHFGSLSYQKVKKMDDVLERNKEYFLKKWGKYLKNC